MATKGDQQQPDKQQPSGDAQQKPEDPNQDEFKVSGRSGRRNAVVELDDDGHNVALKEIQTKMGELTTNSGSTYTFIHFHQFFIWALPFLTVLANQSNKFSRIIKVDLICKVFVEEGDAVWINRRRRSNHKAAAFRFVSERIAWNYTWSSHPPDISFNTHIYL